MTGSSVLSFSVKLQKLEHQLKSAELADYAYPDGSVALEILRSRVRAIAQRVKDSESLTETVRTAILRDANFLIMRVTQIVGIVVRSTSVRNAFELYVPFFDICRSLVGPDARLILSSEWQYIPFTHPLSLYDLPNFIVIGLPAPESDNVLVFPAAGHELGHSMWARHGMRVKFEQKCRELISAEFSQRRSTVEKIFPVTANTDFDQDIFSQAIQSRIVTSAIAQCEETFCDFCGLLLFGEGFLHTFRYLVAPQINTQRSRTYPDTKVRASVLEEYARTKLGIDLSNYCDAFLAEKSPGVEQERFLLEIADFALNYLLEQIFEEANRLFSIGNVASPSSEYSNAAHEAFKMGIPYDGEATIGDLINAAWHVFTGDDRIEDDQQARLITDYLTDLVLKSVEIYEIRKYLS